MKRKSNYWSFLEATTPWSQISRGRCINRGRRWINRGVYIYIYIFNLIVYFQQINTRFLLTYVATIVLLHGISSISIVFISIFTIFVAFCHWDFRTANTIIIAAKYFNSIYKFVWLLSLTAFLDGLACCKQHTWILKQVAPYLINVCLLHVLLRASILFVCCKHSIQIFHQLFH